MHHDKNGGFDDQRNVVFLPSAPSKIGHFVRVGSGHRQFETLLGAGKMPIQSVVIDAAIASKRKELIASLKETGRELMALGLPSLVAAPLQDARQFRTGGKVHVHCCS